jgi:hypothetical protein
MNPAKIDGQFSFEWSGNQRTRSVTGITKTRERSEAGSGDMETALAGHTLADEPGELGSLPGLYAFRSAQPGMASPRRRVPFKPLSQIVLAELSGCQRQDCSRQMDAMDEIRTHRPRPVQSIAAPSTHTVSADAPPRPRVLRSSRRAPPGPRSSPDRSPCAS